MKTKITFLIFITITLFTVNVFASPPRPPQKYECPLCGHEFKYAGRGFCIVYYKDNDLCIQGAPRFNVIRCPKCSLAGSHFYKKYSEAEKKELLALLKDYHNKSICNVLCKLTEIDYEKNQNVDDLNYKLANLYLMESWAKRNYAHLIGYYYGIKIVNEEEKKFKEKEKEKGKVKTGTNNFAIVTYNLAEAISQKENLTDIEKIESWIVLANRFTYSGENIEAEKYLKMVEDLEAEKFPKTIGSSYTKEEIENKMEVLDMVEKLRNSIKNQQISQRKALEYFKKSYEKDLLDEEQIFYLTFMLAELNRRLGNYIDAKKNYLKLAENKILTDKCEYIIPIKFAMKQMGMENETPVFPEKKTETKTDRFPLPRIPIRKK